ncbi:MAG: hypothetical protein JEZ09_13360 [Salinivirgaceae bacterium]|nr:hypothetical protein [Salinivirgaceae bacterium]
MKNIILTLTLAVSLLFCGCNQQKSKQNNKSILVSEKVVNVNYLTVEGLLKQAEDLSYTTIYVSGIIDHVCRHGGKRFKILSTDGSQELKIELGKEFDIMDASVAGNLAKVKGKLKPVKMSAEMVKAWEKNVRDSHKGEENTEHFKQEIAEIQSIYKQITTGEIPFYTIYSVQAEKYELE